MENNYDYKDEIISSRVGALGGSDGKVLAAIANNGCVQRGQVERLAIAHAVKLKTFQRLDDRRRKERSRPFASIGIQQCLNVAGVCSL